jgi:hypothetical protein
MTPVKFWGSVDMPILISSVATCQIVVYNYILLKSSGKFFLKVAQFSRRSGIVIVLAKSNKNSGIF